VTRPLAGVVDDAPQAAFFYGERPMRFDAHGHAPPRRRFFGDVTRLVVRYLL